MGRYLVLKLSGLFLLSLIAILVISCIVESPSISVSEIPVDIYNGKIDSDIYITQGNKVIFKVTSYRAWVLHIHGYVIKVDVFEDKTSFVEFVAQATSSFKLALHEASDGHHDHGKSDSYQKEHGHEEVIIGTIKFAWYLSLFSIVIGHILSIFIAHKAAFKQIKNINVVLKSQYPMLVLMIIYTTTSLWIIVQPIVEIS